MANESSVGGSLQTKLIYNQIRKQNRNVIFNPNNPVVSITLPLV
jgi:hypothetical protein